MVRLNSKNASLFCAADDGLYCWSSGENHLQHWEFSRHLRRETIAVTITGTENSPPGKYWGSSQLNICFNWFPAQ